MILNVLGSCVSRVSLLDGNQDMHGIADDDMKLQYFLDKHNIICAMMPAPFSREEVESIKVEELWDKSRLHSLKQSLNKDTLSLLMSSDADYLVMDLYDMQIQFLMYNNTCFSTQANEFVATKLCEKYCKDIGIANFMDISPALWYGYIDLFFEKIMQKYDSDHIILNRFRCNRFFLARNGYIALIPDDFKKPWQPNEKYNKTLRNLEDYIIEKYHPWVIDLAQYFMGDQNEWDNLNGAHFEREFYRETFDQIKRIVKGETDQRYYSEPDFFNPERRGYAQDCKRSFNVEHNYQVMRFLMQEEDILWLNVLDKLHTYAPDDPRVQEEVDWLFRVNPMG